MANQSEINWARICKLPLQIVMMGISIFIVAKLFTYLGLHPVSWPSKETGSGFKAFIALIVFLVGTGMVSFLWWLSSRYFRLLGCAGENIDKVAQLKDLPMGLPEGTVRAVLALIVAVVGLPLLLFSSQLSASPEIAGYLNGIITGVFGYYFGTRAAASTATTNNIVASAQQAAQEQTRQAERAQNDADQKMELAEKIQSTADVDSLLDKTQRQLALAKALLAMLPQTNSLPTGLGDVLPGDLNNTITRAESIINALRNLSKKDVTPDQLDELNQVVNILTGATSPLSVLLSKAAPLVAPAMPALGPIAGIVMLLGVGAKLGSDQFKRWRARVLAAPLAQGLVESGTLTLPLTRAALEKAPAAIPFFAARPPAEVDSVLANVLAADDPVSVLNEAYGPNGNVAADIVHDCEEATSIVTALQQSLLALYGKGDITEEIASKVRASLTSPASQALGAASAALSNLSATDINQLINLVSGVSSMVANPADSRAAFDLLIMLVDAARRANVDFVQAIADLKL
ncbi:hypothetical protein ACYZFF_11280 [Klebsiella variicola]|uniref:hypothetical protein n=1 Tax=Klebsiella TaxID=570 RepID=UPI001C9A417D|nr:hypothetical protein [Klebsiella variicola]MBY7262582.1 hypothetical protein [Klebsiella variicola]MCQ3898133.1 hypothetical protein [Klebsiella variicola]HCA9669769.1 hypothetical protein [Klebsiella variicola subsp. variicola]HED4044390.1 hypothetical protein [Klebsiella variicola subsp. variicola]